MPKHKEGGGGHTPRKTVNSPITVKAIYRHSRSLCLVLDTNNNLYKLSKRRIVKVQELYPTLWTLQNTQPIKYTDTNTAIKNAEFNAFSEIAKKLNVTPEEAHELSLEIDKEDEAEFLSRFSEIANKRGITPEEVYEEMIEETGKQVEEYLKQLNEERITRMKKLIQFRKGQAFVPYKPKDTT